MGIGLTAPRAQRHREVAARAADVFASADMSPRAPRAEPPPRASRVPRWAHFFTRRGRSRESDPPRHVAVRARRSQGHSRARAGSFMTILVRSAQTSH